MKNIKLRIGERILFTTNHLSIHSGVVALTGRNGAGKSTFIKALLGQHKEYDGDILFDGISNKNIPGDQLAKKIAVVLSKPELFGDYKVMDVMLLGRIPYMNLAAIPKKTDIEKVHEIAGLLKITEHLHRKFHSLSDGEKQMVMIGRALVQDTPYVVMDEPAAFLDVVNRYEIHALLRQIAQRTNKIILTSTHHIERLEQDADFLLLIAEQEMKLYNQASEFSAVVKSAFGI
ncbi:MAG: ABC transporter ATP-binding protein [Crocinitomicaceae bacterium]|nr:ABC transporter ATP-binding protein [Crocinitomicaceae bacterium]MBK8925157.1 ABC transporter ATP-binding protein [Crocinitomicaceae bacterium]